MKKEGAAEIPSEKAILFSGLFIPNPQLFAP